MVFLSWFYSLHLLCAAHVGWMIALCQLVTERLEGDIPELTMGMSHIGSQANATLGHHPIQSCFVPICDALS